MPGRWQAPDARQAAWRPYAAGLGAAVLAAILGKAVLHMPASAQLATLALCGLSVGLAGLACYELLASLLSPVEESEP
jgi:hypothetical protein